MAGDETFSCPRCGAEVAERFWGPCSECRSQLVVKFRAEKAVAPIEVGRFEPALHVVPNHVATKD